MQVQTPKQFLEEVLPQKFRREKAANIDVVAQLNLTGPNGGNWVVTIKNQTLKVTAGTYPSPTLTLKVADSDFVDIVNGKSSATAAFFSGKIHIIGDLGLALKLKDTGLLNGV